MLGATTILLWATQAVGGLGSESEFVESCKLNSSRSLHANGLLESRPPASS